MSRFKKHRKLVQKEQNSKSSEKKGLPKEAWWAIFVGLLMILSVVGSVFVDKGDDGTIAYGDFKFKYVNGEYITKINKKELKFNFHPSELESIVIPKEAEQKIAASPQILLTFKPEQDNTGADFARFEISTAMYAVGKNTQEGIDGFDTRYYLSKMSCKNATDFVPVISLEIANSTQIIYKDNCIIFNAEKQEDFVKLKDRLLYFLYGVMK